MTTITDEYVPSGAMKFAVKDASKFSVGDTIEVRRPVTQAWVEFMGMHDLTRDEKRQTWLGAGNNTVHERRISDISNNVLTVDVPLPDSFDAKFLSPNGATVAKT